MAKLELEGLLSILNESDFLNSLFITLYRFFSGFFLSVLLAGFSVWLGLKFKFLGKSIKFTVSAIQPIPKVVLFPLILISFGMNDFSRILLVLIGLFFTNYTILNVATLKLLNDPSLHIIRFYRSPRLMVLYYYYIKGLKEASLTVFKNSIGYGLTLTIIAESSFCNDGLGYLIWTFWERYELGPLYFTVVITSLVAICLNYLTDYFVNLV